MTSDIESKIKPPAIGLIVVGILNLPFSIYLVLTVVMQLALGEFNRPFADDTTRMTFYIVFYGIGILGLIGTAIAPVLIYGGIQMRKGKKYRFARIASVLAIIPITSSCFLVGIPVGIWSFFVLRNPDVKAYFDRQN